MFQKSLIKTISNDKKLIESELVALEVEQALSERLSKLLSDNDLIHLTELLKDSANPEEIKNFLQSVCPEIESILEEEINKVKEKHR